MIFYTVEVNGKEKTFVKLIDAQEFLSDILDRYGIVDARPYDVKLIREHFVAVKGEGTFQ